jgi:hypothetical protein
LWWREFVKTASATAIPKRRHLSAAAILGQAVGLAELKHKTLERFILNGRTYFSLVMASSARTTPSGHVTGSDRGGHVQRLFFFSEQVFDRFFVIYCRVFYAKKN